MDLDLAISIAVLAHRGQTRQNGEPYIFHVLRVMLALRDDEDAAIVGVLHDVLEDTDFGENSLIKCGIKPHQLEALKLLTRTNNETYEEYLEYVKNIAKNPLAKKVKLADLADNMNLDDLDEELTEYDFKRYNKYRKARSILLESNPFDILAEHAIQEYKEGKTQDFRSFAKELGIEIEEDDQVS